MTRQSATLSPVSVSLPASSVWFSVWAIVAAFGTYFCMYGFRKPFTAAAYEEYSLWGFGYKTVLITAQVLGYTLSKFIGIRVIAEMQPAQRARRLLVFVGLAQASLLLFALVPAPWNWWCLFLNGLPLGMVFGLVLGFLEGRQVTETLTAGLCASFILADGVAKSVGAYLLAAGVSQFWMPFISGCLFTLPLLISVWMLTRIPPPDAADVQQRHERVPMTSHQRRTVFWKYAPGLILLTGTYLLLTILRSLRADFAPELWQGMGYTRQPDVFTRSEFFVMFGVVTVNGFAVLTHNNRRAFFAALGIALAGFVLTGAALVGLRYDHLTGFAFMILIGLGLYLPYVAVHTTVFERLLAMTGDKGNIGYLMYLADAFGYLGYVVVMLTRSLVITERNFVTFFISLSEIITIIAALLLIGCWIYFAFRTRL